MASGSAKSVMVKRLHRVLQKWPADPSRKGRDLGEFLKHSYKDNFNQIAETNPSRALETVQSLERLNSNYYRQLYKRREELSFSGDILLKNPGILSNENLEDLKKEQSSRLGSLWQAITNWRRKERN